jgi:hypothetical protein
MALAFNPFATLKKVKKRKAVQYLMQQIAQSTVNNHMSLCDVHPSYCGLGCTVNPLRGM